MTIFMVQFYCVVEVFLITATAWLGTWIYDWWLKH